MLRLVFGIASLGAAALAASQQVAVRVEGEGYLRFLVGGSIAYAKSATLILSGGKLALKDGSPLTPAIEGQGKPRIDLEGNVFFEGTAAPAGRIVLAIFPAGTDLRPQGEILRTKVKPSLANPGEGIAGVVRTGPAAPSAEPFRTKQAKSVTITVAPMTEIETVKISLGQVAKIEGDPAARARLEGVFLGEAPAVGLKRLLTKQSLVTRLLAAKERTEGLVILVPEGAFVARKGQTVSSEDISAAALAYIRSQTGADFQAAQIEQPKSVLAPLGEVLIAGVSMLRMESTLAVTVVVSVSGKQVATRTVKLQVDPAAGVKRGDEVRIRIRANGAVVELTGRAKESALVGQSVQVTTSRNTTHTGKVVGPGLVEVSL